MVLKYLTGNGAKGYKPPGLLRFRFFEQNLAIIQFVQCPINRELAKLVQDARRRKFDVVLTWSLDRLSRLGAAAILNLVNTLKPVKVYSHEEAWTETPGIAGDLLFAISGWVAEMESQRRSERTRAGLARVKAQGRRLGRPPGSKDKRRRKRRQWFAVS